MTPNEQLKYDLFCKKMSGVSKKVWSDQERRKRASETQKASYIKNPSRRENVSLANKKRFEDPNERKRNSDAQKKRWEDPKQHETASISQKKRFENPDERDKIRKSVIKTWNEHPELRVRQSKITKKYFEDPLSRKKASESLIKKLWESTEYIIKHISIYYGDEFLYGHLKISVPKYCEIFKEVDPRVRAFQGNKCLLCEKTEEESGKKLHDHHVFYEKKTCCWIDYNDEYWTNLNAPDHVDRDYYIGDNPNYFALLCTGCHSSTGGNYENRKESADKLRNIIDAKFGGKSYYTEEEMIKCGYTKITKTKWKKLN